ncbi:MAG: hypothetical protein PHI34_13125 [Acidobacteriota bacterium]|nr:hypothetical protein [Acidobacteriota bacterium]
MRRKRQKFWTGMQTLGDEPYQPSPPFKGAGWEAALVPQRKTPHTIYNGQEVVLLAGSWATAQRALDLIRGCHTLAKGDPDVFKIQLIANNDQEPDWADEEERKALLTKTCGTHDFPLACAIAAKASRRRQWVYAVARYEFSLSLYSVHHVDLEPWKSPHLAISSFPGDHVMLAHAIISAYSVVEDIGLTVRASPKKPSQIDGKWNPQVKADLEHRLTQAGIDLSEPILWTARGGKRRIEIRRPLPAGSKAPWFAWIVRDTKIPIVDAIAYSEWLRSCVASHGVKDLTRALSPYDVINVQHVARRVLLDLLGFWRWHQKERIQTMKAMVPTDARLRAPVVP